MGVRDEARDHSQDGQWIDLQVGSLNREVKNEIIGKKNTKENKRK